MEHLEQAKALYRKRHDHGTALSADDRDCLHTSIRKLICYCLEQQEGVSSFMNPPFIHIIKRTVANNHFDGDKAASAFDALEDYLLLLLAQPWKREFWLLKTYSGYFSTKVKAHLDGPEEVLQLVGYRREEGSNDDSRLIMERPPDAQVVLDVAFDCQVARVECKYIMEFYQKMKYVGFSLTDAMNIQLSGFSNEQVGTPAVIPQGKVGMPLAGTTSNHFVGTKSSDMPKRNGGRVMGQPSVGAPLPRMMGVSQAGVGSGSNVHQVTGVPPRPAVWNHQMSQSQHGRLSGQPLGGAFHGDMPQQQPHGGQSPSLSCLSATTVTGPTIYAHPPTYADVTGHPPTYADVTGPVIQQHTPSWMSASSGYNSAAPSQICAHNNYTHNAVDLVDSPTAMAPPPPPPQLSSSNRRIQPDGGSLRQPWQPPPPEFPYIDDDTISPCMEATHAQHLQESARVMHSALPSKNRTQVLAPQATGPQSRGMGREGIWTGSGSLAHNGEEERASSLVQRPAHHSADTTRWSSSQPATAVTALLNQGSPLIHSDPRRPPSMDPSQHRAPHSCDFPQLSASRSGAGTGPLSEPPRSGSITRNNSSVASKKLYENIESRKAGMRSQVFYPPTSENPPAQAYTVPNTVPTYQPRPSPALAQMDPGSGDKWGLVARQTQGSQISSVSIPDKPPPARGGSSGSGSSSEVIRRSKVKDTVGTGAGRCHSLISPKGVGSHPTELSRQTSRSLDVGTLKWKCQACTMENVVSDLICIACSRSRDAPEDHFPVAGDSKLPCPSCTFENPPGRVKCEICSGLLPQDVHTYV